MGLFSPGVEQMSGVSPVTHFIVRFQWIIHIPVVFSGIMTVAHLCGRGLDLMRLGISYAVLVLTLSLISGVWAFGLGWPAFDRMFLDEAKLRSAANMKAEMLRKEEQGKEGAKRSDRENRE